MSRIPLLGALTILLTCPSIGVFGAETNPYNIDDQLDQTIRMGFHELFDLNFDKAEQIFNGIQDRAAEHPLAAFGLATVQWWKISVDVSESDMEASKPFLEAADRCVKISQAKIKKGDPMAEGYLTLGSVEALLARWEAANHNWMAVYHRGKKARNMLRHALKINPQAVDANMALGILDYTLAHLSAVARFFSGPKVSGNPEHGLHELETAAEKGIYLRVPAIFLLANIYSEDLKSPYRTVAMMSNLRKEIHTSPFLDLLMFTALYNQDCPVELMAEVEDFEYRLNTGQYRPEFNAQCNFLHGMAHFKAREWRPAIESFDSAIQNPNQSGPYRIWSMLYKGYALDALGERDKAVELYKAVVSERPRWKSQEYAERRLKHRFKASDRELDTLLL